MSTVATNTSVFTNRSFPFDNIIISQLEKRNRKYYIDYSVEDTPIFLQINKVKLVSEPIFIDDEQGYIDIEIQDRINEISKFFDELNNYNQLICFKNSEEWLGKSLEMDEVEKVYKNSYKDRVLRLKIERETIKMYDMFRNKLNVDNDLKIGDTLDVIMEISGLKLMKSSFSTYIVLRQIRKHPEHVPKKKNIPNEYLFLDEYSNRTKNIIRDDNSLDDQTDVDMILTKNKNNTQIKNKPIHELMGGYSESYSNISNVANAANVANVTLNSKKKSNQEPNYKSTSLVQAKDEICEEQIKKDLLSELIESRYDFDENTNDYLDCIVNTMNKSNQLEDSSANDSRKDKILNALEKGDIGLDSIIAAENVQKVAKKKLKTSKKQINSNFTNEQLHKYI